MDLRGGIKKKAPLKKRMTANRAMNKNQIKRNDYELKIKRVCVKRERTGEEGRERKESDRREEEKEGKKKERRWRKRARKTEKRAV